MPISAVTAPEPLLPLRPYQAPVFWRDDLGLFIIYWRRQSGKTRTLSGKTLRWMIEDKGSLTTYASASLNLGREFIVKGAGLWYEALEKYRQVAKARDMLLETSVDGLNFDDFCDIFERQKLVLRLRHSNTLESRAHVIAPNAATARSWTGYVIVDEIGFVPDLKELLEGMEPIMSSSARFRCIMATTPPEDDTNYAYELLVPPVGLEFKPENANPKGHWYESQAGIMIHRADVWDTDLAGVQVFDTKTRKPISPEQSRVHAFDKSAWDRNYALILKAGGAAAVSLMAIQQAMTMGKGKCLAAEDEFPPGWQNLLGTGVFSVGADPATTEKEKSNPFSITIMERVGMTYFARLVVRFKTADPERAKFFLRQACELGKGRKPRRLVLDASSERFWCAEVKREFASICPVELMVAGEKMEYQGEEMTTKTYLGNLLCNALDDMQMAIANETWLKDDFRLVMRDKGSFTTRVDSAGNHGDTFDSTKNALHGLISKSGPTQAAAAQVGTYATGAAVNSHRMKMRPDHSADNRKSTGVRYI